MDDNGEAKATYSKSFGIDDLFDEMMK